MTGVVPQGVPHGYDFDFDTRLTRAGEGAFEIEISDRWSGLASVNGGFLMAVCLKALAASPEVPFPDPVTVSGLYLRPGNAGPTVVRTELIRAGRTTAFCEAHLLQAGKEVLRVASAFADLSGVTAAYTGATAPKLPAPEECPQLTGLAVISLSNRLEFRGPAVPGWLAGKPSGDPFAEFWMRFADGRPADTMTLPFIVDAAPPAVLELGMSSTTIELTVHVRARPAPGWLACRTSTRFVSGGYHEEDFEVWDSAGMLVAQSRQLALVRPFGALPPLISAYLLGPRAPAPGGPGIASRAEASPRLSSAELCLPKLRDSRPPSTGRTMMITAQALEGRPRARPLWSRRVTQEIWNSTSSPAKPTAMRPMITTASDANASFMFSPLRELALSLRATSASFRLPRRGSAKPPRGVSGFAPVRGK